ncbi:MAG: GAF domain-containing protein [Candidatus Eremiobacterota bacterium]
MEKLEEEIKKEKELSEELKKDLSSGVEKLYEELNKEKELIAALKKEKELTAELKTTITAERKNFHEEMEKEIGILAALNNTVTEEREKFQKELKEEKNLRVEMEKLNEKLKKDLTEEMDKLYEEIKKEKELTENMEKVLEEVKKEREFTEEQKKTLEEMKKEIKQRKRSQKTLQENKFTLEMAQKISRLGYWSYNIQNNMYEWSDEMFRILGCSTEGGVPSYEDCKKIIHKDDWQRFDRAFKEAVNTGKSYNMDLKIIFPDMSIHYVNARACPQYDKDNNKITALFGVMQDITERKFLEEELKKSLDKLNIKNQIAGLFLTVSGENISWKILPAIMKSLKSIYGIFGLIDNNGNLVKTAGYIDRDHNIQISDGIIIKREGWSEGLKEILHEGKTCFSNTPASEGEIQIHRSLSVPLFRSGKPSGVLTVANKEEDYKEEDKILLQTIAEIVSPVLNARLESNRLKAELNGLEYQIKKAQKVEADLIQNILLK